jgi:Asp-tRNA(Asn)/Glu-tRNA(Gln) amidotransferase A subunit family amidase
VARGEGDDLAYMPATELVTLIQRRQVSPLEVVDALLARIDAYNEQLNLFCFVYAEEARQRAREAERAIARGDAPGPLTGIPIALKDFTPTKGRRTTLGSRVFRDWVPDEDPPIVERLDRAGAVLIGKTTTPEFAHSAWTHSPLWGVSRNPWDRARTPGGSSGGSAGAVAAGMVPLAEGSDAGGSIRIPAAFCGVVGFKPSLGRVPMHITPSDFETIFHLGPIARTVADAALMFSVLQGPDERDPMSVVPALHVPRDLDISLRGVRLALSFDLGYYDVDDEVRAHTEAAARALAGAGAEVEEVDLPWTRAINDAWEAYWGTFLAALYGDALGEHRDELDPGVVKLMDAGMEMGAVEFKRIDLVRTRQWHQLRPILDSHHALVCPTTAVPAPSVDDVEESHGGRSSTGRYRGLYLTCPFNFIGQCPVISVPSGYSHSGLPMGLQIVGRRYDDVTVLRLAAAFERISPWSGRRPPL